ncbi:aldehyde reductase [Flavobacterium sp. ANB]|uniref:SDR family oxidoreductase n=1 Tax=unclassified Flavobacterium TaxID=196869 RepID=UPI0012B7FA60|nr:MULTISPECIES: aldehyde reductase [unclassified Flavobacterium]MBF4517909.1 aldehyde reductase [Flavobacterium sp. ANB]MTD71347.1 NAD(P)H-binding protein [Flavobacterium sp. LC2016-13]
MENKDIVLVTGGTGFVAMQIIMQLLQKGFQVRTTVRNLKNKDKIIAVLKANDVTNLDNLSFVVTELTEDHNWEAALKGCKYVLSVASPVFFEKPKSESQAIRPAVEGILRVLKFANQEGVKRVVMTSNFGAVGFSQTDKTRQTTESDWTNPNMKGLSVYEKSKTLAEKAAWDYIKNSKTNLEFTTINAVAIMGPSLNEHITGSFMLLENLLNGKMKAVPNIPLNIVDVRDVADLHIRAMITPEANGQRFIASADGQISLPEIAILLKNKRPNIAEKVSSKILPNWIIKIGAIFNVQAKEGIVFLNMNRNISNTKAKNILSWKPIATQETTILSAVDSMIKYNLINKNI